MVILRFAALYAFWIVLSGRFETKYLVMGGVCALLVIYLTQDLTRPDGAGEGQRREKDYSILTGIGRFVLYFFWLLWSVVQSNLQVAYIVLHPKLPIQPGLLRLRTTIDFDDGDYSVHALVPGAAQSLLDAKMQSKLERIFGEREEAKTEIRWVDKPGG
jgi:multicomponent Na+:H+ antiporter subunit E